MADRNLTFDDFLKLSEDERAARYCELSDRDKFRARCSQNSGVDRVPCNDCKLYLGYAKCTAHPYGIPRELLLAKIEDPPSCFSL